MRLFKPKPAVGGVSIATGLATYWASVDDALRVSSGGSIETLARWDARDGLYRDVKDLIGAPNAA